jgi:hypothetical protein
MGGQTKGDVVTVPAVTLSHENGPRINFPRQFGIQETGRVRNSQTLIPGGPFGDHKLGAELYPAIAELEVTQPAKRSHCTSALPHADDDEFPQFVNHHGVTEIWSQCQ